jgi:hypothetical protein
MKKVLSLVLALVMILTAVAAMAEAANSPTVQNQGVINNGVVAGGAVVEKAEEIALAPIEVEDLEEDLQDLMKQFESAAESTTEDVLTVVKEQVDKDKIIAILEKNQDVTTVLSKDVKVLEMVPFKLTGDLTNLETALEASISFKSALPNQAGDFVAVMISAVINGEVTDFVLEGVVNAKGGVDIVIPEDTAKKLAGKDLIITVLGI